ncbi:MAG: bifunctional precorrin-2 dehydrogenase/sirohydrochlorin ferrochelatase [Candidatus Omnitrophica bacterium]|nr:bifunctional precorrin-2 dehydrogenase/sirohydrochlorin ferrochelatase [Candidatus Omnitrophota bacterium]
MSLLDYMPVCLRLKGAECLIVGGGNVAWRKIKVLKKFGAALTCISPEFVAPLEKWGREGKVCCQYRRYPQNLSLKKYQLVFAATDDPAVNRRVAADAARAKILVNVADQSAPGTMIMPAILKRKYFLISVSTGGRSPALAKQLRDKLDAVL